MIALGFFTVTVVACVVIYLKHFELKAALQRFEIVSLDQVKKRVESLENGIKGISTLAQKCNQQEKQLSNQATVLQEHDSKLATLSLKVGFSK